MQELTKRNPPPHFVSFPLYFRFQFSGVGRDSITAHFELPDIPGRRPVTAAAAAAGGANRRVDPSRLPRAGEFTNNGVGNSRYNLISGEAAPNQWRLLPNYGAHASRVPVHTLEQTDTRRALLSDEDALSRPPTSRTAGVTRGVDLGREYTMATGAFSPAGFRSPVRRDVVPEKAVEYTSFHDLTRDKTKHVRPVNEPLARTMNTAAPMLSSQSYGWESKRWETMRREEAMAREGAAKEGDVGYFGGTMRKPRVGCRETKMAQSLLLGPRHVHGFSGQGTL